MMLGSKSALAAESSCQSTRDELGTSTENCAIQFAETCKTQPCFVFLDEDPFVQLPPKASRDPKVFKELRSFPCRKFRDFNVEGITFQLLEAFFKDVKNVTEDFRCYYGGDSCGWNYLVNYVQFGGRTYEEDKRNETKPYQLVLLGSLLETPARLRKKSIPSVSYADDKLVVVGRAEDIKESLFYIILGPLDRFVWLMVGATIAVAFLTGLLLKYSHPGREHLRESAMIGKTTGEWLKHHCLDSVVSALAHLLGKEEIAGPATESKEAIRAEAVLGKSQENGSSHYVSSGSLMRHRATERGSVRGGLADVWTPSMHQRDKRVTIRMGCHIFIKVLFSITLTFFVGIILLLYEAALTSFLFLQTTPKLEQGITSLTVDQLKSYAVLNNSAVNDVWVKLQCNNKNKNWSTRDEQPWDDCRDIDTCFRDLKRGGKHNFLVVQDTVARFKIKNDKSCGELSIFETEEALFDFNSGLIYGPSITPELQRDIDLVLLRSRITGRSTRIFDKFLEDSICRKQVNSITWRVYIIPTLLVCGSVGVLILVQFGLIFFNRRERARRRIDLERMASASLGKCELDEESPAQTSQSQSSPGCSSAGLQVDARGSPEMPMGVGPSQSQSTSQSDIQLPGNLPPNYPPVDSWG